MRALYTAATGMAAQELNVQVISNNIANLRTTGFKKQRAAFQDLIYDSSWNAARCCLKPVVRKLAMLLEMTWTFSSWAAIPVAAVYKARMGQVSLGRNVGELLDGGLVEIALLLQQGRHLGVGAGHLDHAAHFHDRVDVGLFDESLAQLRGRVGLRRDAIARRVKVGAVLQEFLRIGETDHPQLAAHRIDPVEAFEHGDVAVLGDRDVVVGRLEHDRAGVAEHGIAGRRHQLALTVDIPVSYTHLRA